MHIGRGCVMIHRISIHALLAESDGDVTVPPQKAVGFLSTLSLRRATFRSYFPWPFLAAISIHALLAESDPAMLPQLWRRFYFYPRSPCGERLRLRWLLCLVQDFYPRSPCGERRSCCTAHQISAQFLSTLSLRRATGCQFAPQSWCKHFYPRSPCGERHSCGGGAGIVTVISIHALLAESDVHLLCCLPRTGISIHALLAESDWG